MHGQCMELIRLGVSGSLFFLKASIYALTSFCNKIKTRQKSMKNEKSLEKLRKDNFNSTKMFSIAAE